MADTLERIERMPWYGVGLFTGVVLLIVSVSVHHFKPLSYLYFGGEYGAVGLALAQGRGFSDPFSIGSGATAWVSPLLPAIIGFVFYLTRFGMTAYGVLLAIKIASLGLGTGLIWSVLQSGRRGLAPLCYLWMGVFCWIYRIEIFYQYHDEWLIFLIISLAFWAWHRRAALRGRIALTAALSAAALANPILWGALLTATVIFRKGLFGPTGQSGEDRLNGPKTISAGGALWTAIGISLLLAAGWTVRNWIQLDMLAPIKSNAGYELFQSQIISKNGSPDASTFKIHPTIPDSEEKQAYGRWGEKVFIHRRQDMAVRRILADPADFARRVAHRFRNAFLFTETPYNTAFVDPGIGRDDLERLRRAGFIAHNLYKRNIWIDLDHSGQEFDRLLPPLGLDDPQRVLADRRWRSAAYDAYRFSWDRMAGGVLTGGLPWIALLIVFRRGNRSGLMPVAGWAGLFLCLYLMPYVLISHYLRYQVPLLGVQAILMGCGTLALLTAADDGKRLRL